MAKRKKLDNLILAEGEATGHMHEARGRGAALYDADGTCQLDAPHGATVTHQEHGAVTLPAQDYDVSKVIEQDHAADEAREVRD